MSFAGFHNPRRVAQSLDLNPPMGEFLSVSDLATVWYMLKAVPGLMPFIGYLFGLLVASWAFDEYFWDG
jgi:hypothetical protein